MKTDCIQPDDLARVLTLPVHSPERQHLVTCLHCRAMALAYEEFLDADGVRPGFDLDAADAQLAERLAGIIAGPAPAAKAPVLRPRFAVRRGWLAAAAVLLVCAGIFVARDSILRREAQLPRGVGAVRGDAADPTALAWSEGEDGWRLTWRMDTPGSPELVFFDADLVELTRRSLGGFDGDVHAAEVDAPEDAVYLQIIFAEEGDVVARSAVIAARPDEP